MQDFNNTPYMVNSTIPYTHLAHMHSSVEKLKSQVSQLTSDIELLNASLQTVRHNSALVQKRLLKKLLEQEMVQAKLRIDLSRNTYCGFEILKSVELLSHTGASFIRSSALRNKDIEKYQNNSQYLNSHFDLCIKNLHSLRVPISTTPGECYNKEMISRLMIVQLQSSIDAVRKYIIRNNVDLSNALPLFSRHPILELAKDYAYFHHFAILHTQNIKDMLETMDLLYAHTFGESFKQKVINGSRYKFMSLPVSNVDGKLIDETSIRVGSIVRLYIKKDEFVYVVNPLTNNPHLNPTADHYLNFDTNLVGFSSRDRLLLEKHSIKQITINKILRRAALILHYQRENGERICITHPCISNSCGLACEDLKKEHLKKVENTTFEEEKLTSQESTAMSQPSATQFVAPSSSQLDQTSSTKCSHSIAIQYIPPMIVQENSSQNSPRRLKRRLDELDLPVAKKKHQDIIEIE